MVRNALRRLGPDAGKATEFVDEVLYRSSEESQGSGAAEHSAKATKIHAAYGIGLAFLDLGCGIAQGRKDEVVEHLDIVGIHNRWIDLDRVEVHPTVNLNTDHAATARSFYHLGGRFLSAGQHCLGLLHQAAEVHTTSSASEECGHIYACFGFVLFSHIAQLS